MVRCLAGVLLALSLSACGAQRVPLEYTPMGESSPGPAPVTGQESGMTTAQTPPVVMLEVSGSPDVVAGRLGANRRQFLGASLEIGDYLAGRDILDMTRAAVRAELNNRGITVGASPVLVAVHVGQFSVNLREPGGTSLPNGAALATLDVTVFAGDDKTVRFDRGYRGAEDAARMKFPSRPMVGRLVSDAFAKAMRAAMGDDALFAAIRAAQRAAGS